MKKLNIGCGRDIRKGWINLDKYNKHGADMIWDLNNLPLPFKDNSFDYVYCSHVLEDFINPIPIMDEMVRITKVGGKIEIRVPNETHINDAIYHQKAFNLLSFKSYVDVRYMDEYYGRERKIIIEKLEFCSYNSPKKNVKFYGRLYYNLCVFVGNLLGAKIMCNTFVKHLFPMLNIRCIYKKLAKQKAGKCKGEQ